jgi:hypothetical protein
MTTTLNNGDIVEVNGESYVVQLASDASSPRLEKCVLPTTEGIYTTGRSGQNYGLKRALLDRDGTWHWLDMSRGSIGPVDPNFERDYAHKLTLVHPYTEA